VRRFWATSSGMQVKGTRCTVPSILSRHDCEANILRTVASEVLVDVRGGGFGDLVVSSPEPGVPQYMLGKPCRPRELPYDVNPAARVARQDFLYIVVNAWLKHHVDLAQDLYPQWVNVQPRDLATCSLEITHGPIDLQDTRCAAHSPQQFAKQAVACSRLLLVRPELTSKLVGVVDHRHLLVPVVDALDELEPGNPTGESLDRVTEGLPVCLQWQGRINQDHIEVIAGPFQEYLLHLAVPSCPAPSLAGDHCYEVYALVQQCGQLPNDSHQRVAAR